MSHHEATEELKEGEEKSEKRFHLLKRIFEEFKSLDSDSPIIFRGDIDTLAREINNYYWDFIQFIKDSKYVVKGKKETAESISDDGTLLNIFKIISATELAIVRHQPVKGGQKLNAELASFVSFYFFRTWFKKDLNSISFSSNQDLNEIWNKFMRDRITWLTNMDALSNFPFFLNSQVWMLIYMLTRDTIEKTK